MLPGVRRSTRRTRSTRPRSLAWPPCGEKLRERPRDLRPCYLHQQSTDFNVNFKNKQCQICYLQYNQQLTRAAKAPLARLHPTPILKRLFKDSGISTVTEGRGINTDNSIDAIHKCTNYTNIIKRTLFVYLTV